MPKENYGDRQGWNNKLPRYYIDQRVGCIAVRDSTFRDSESCLEQDSAGVLWFKMGIEQDSMCKECGHKKTEWIVPEELINEAIKIADQLNGF